MKYSHYRISLDIHSTQSQVSLPVKQGDTNRKVLISLCEGGKPYQIEDDCYAVFSARKPDGSTIENYCIIADNVIEYTFTEQNTAVGGMLNCEIKLYGGDSGLITSPRFTVIVDARAVSDEEIESYSEFSALTNLYTITNSAANNANGKADYAQQQGDYAKEQGDYAKAEAANANTAASSANSKAELATTAAENATAKANLANTAAENAEAKAELADIATATANTAIAEANKARDDANDAAENANAKADLVNTATNNANEATKQANAAATLANSKANLAEEKASYAQAKGDYANTEASNANNAVERVNQSVAIWNNNVQTAVSNANEAADNATAAANLAEEKATFTKFVGDTVLADYGNAKKQIGNALKGSASGNPIRLDDVSPLEHVMKVKLSDPSATLKRCGKNILPYPYSETTLTRQGIKFTDNGDGSITAKGTATGLAFLGLSSKLYLGKKEISSQDSGLGYKVSENVFYNPSNRITSLNFSKGDVVDKTFYPMVVVGDILELEYEPYNGETYTDINEDGTVDNVTSLYPTTTLICDTAGVTIDVEYNKDANKVIEELIALISVGKSFVTDVNILADKWVGTASPYSQVVTVEGATKRSQVDLTPSAEQLAIFHSKDLAFVTENNNGVITVYAIGQKPMNDYTIQATVTEVNV